MDTGTMRRAELVVNVRGHKITNYIRTSVEITALRRCRGTVVPGPTVARDFDSLDRSLRRARGDQNVEGLGFVCDSRTNGGIGLHQNHPQNSSPSCTNKRGGNFRSNKSAVVLTSARRQSPQIKVVIDGNEGTRNPRDLEDDTQCWDEGCWLSTVKGHSAKEIVGLSKALAQRRDRVRRKERFRPSTSLVHVWPETTGQRGRSAGWEIAFYFL
ncbi:hypothetical protein BD410DRAFT_809472 [Rickenella mellea]|uniref:Uncharacterized protein n=1 Tax=Rickenella mellea TaxID=50990 RepID=A0A4Y7PH34_9AGAM|nr:hypothetical protein BD410DRAFT_809472 [Rickenella mellea]